LRAGGIEGPDPAAGRSLEAADCSAVHVKADNNTLPVDSEGKGLRGALDVETRDRSVGCAQEAVGRAACIGKISGDVAVGVDAVGFGIERALRIECRHGSVGGPDEPVRGVARVEIISGDRASVVDAPPLRAYRSFRVDARDL